MECFATSHVRESLPGQALNVAVGAPHDGAAYEVGTVIRCKYRLEELVGEGGMGSVWRATNLQLDCPVALKLIRAEEDRPELRLRLQLEARAAAKLSYPSIVRIFDVDETERGDPFIVMEMLTGETLSQVSFDAPLSPVRAVQLLLPIAGALSVAHASGIVHRDLKPDNIFIAEDGGRVQPKLLDFGIAKIIDTLDGIGSLTQSGSLIGTPDYMSPERARGQSDLDARADLWSFCVVLYEQVAGMMPFVGNNPHAILRAIIEDEPIPLPTDSPGAAELWAIVRRGLAKQPCDRFQSMADLGRALAAWLKSQGICDDACGLSVETQWLRSDKSSAPTLLAVPERSRTRREAGRLAGIAPRRLVLPSVTRWAIALAVFAVTLSGAASIAQTLPVHERAERLPAVISLAKTVAPEMAAVPAAPRLDAQTPSTAAVKTVLAPPAVAATRRLPRAPVQRVAPPTVVARMPVAPRGDTRSASLDLIAPY